MTSFIYTLSIFVLVLANGYFTLPIVDEQLSTEKTVLNDQTSISSAIDTKRTIDDEHIGFTVSPSVDENLVQKNPRTFDEFFTSEPMSFTTEQSSNDKRDHHDLVVSSSDPMIVTTEEPLKDKRDHEDLVFSSSDPMTYTTEEPLKDKRNLFGLPIIPIDPMEFTTEQSSNETVDHNDYPFTTPESYSQISELERRDFKDKFESETEEMPVELTTINTLSFSSTSSTNAPELYESEPSVSPSTEHKIEHETEENLKESTIPTALYDQDALKLFSKIPSGVAILDDNKDFIVRNIPDNSSISIKKNKNKEEVKLNQGKESSHIEEKESNN